MDFIGYDENTPSQAHRDVLDGLQTVYRGILRDKDRNGTTVYLGPVHGLSPQDALHNLAMGAREGYPGMNLEGQVFNDDGVPVFKDGDAWPNF